MNPTQTAWGMIAAIEARRASDVQDYCDLLTRKAARKQISREPEDTPKKRSGTINGH